MSSPTVREVQPVRIPTNLKSYRRFLGEHLPPEVLETIVEGLLLQVLAQMTDIELLSDRCDKLERLWNEHHDG